jgi:hypothetical protein
VTLKFTRRKLAATLAAPAVAALAEPQTPPPAVPGDELQAARARLGLAVDALAGQAVPVDAEPAFQFKA